MGYTTAESTARPVTSATASWPQRSAHIKSLLMNFAASEVFVKSEACRGQRVGSRELHFARCRRPRLSPSDAGRLSVRLCNNPGLATIMSRANAKLRRSMSGAPTMPKRLLLERLFLERLALIVCCLCLFVSHALAEETQYYRIIPFSESATTCRHANTALTPCMTVEVLVLKPTNEFAACTATFDTPAMLFKFSDVTPNPSCRPMQCSTCNLIPPMPPTETGGHLFRSFSPFFIERRNGTMYWGVNQKTGILTVCTLDPAAAECRTVKP